MTFTALLRCRDEALLLRLRLGLLALALLLAAALPLQAAFFMRLRGSDSQLLRTLGGRTLYRASARINGEKAELRVHGFDLPLAEMADEVRRLWHLAPIPQAMGAWITREERGRLINLLLLPGNDEGSSTAWLIERSARSPRAEAIPPPPGGNPLPDSELRTWVLNERTRSLLVLSESLAAPEAALKRAVTSLEDEGWIRMLERSSASLALLARDGRAALVFASRAEGERFTTVTVLRQGGVSR